MIFILWTRYGPLVGLVLCLFYLLLEASFNVLLLDSAGVPHLSSDNIHQVELLGRGISGLGLTILIVGLLPRQWLERPLRALFTALSTLAITWPIAFYGQPYLIDRYLISPASAEIRKQADFALLMREGIGGGAMHVEGIPYDPSTELLPEDKTFLALFGGLVLLDDSLYNALYRQRQAIVKSHVQGGTDTGFERSYQRFLRARTTLQGAWGEYQKGQNEYNRRMNEITLDRKAIMARIESEIAAKYPSYRARSDEIVNAAKQKVPAVHRQLTTFFRNYLRDNKSESRQNKMMQQYRGYLKKEGVGYVPPEYWLSTRSEQAKGIAGGIMGLSPGKRMSLNFNDILQSKGLSFSNNEYITRIKLENLIATNTLTHQTGYPLGLSMREFRTHSATQQSIQRFLSGEGLSLPGLFNISSANAPAEIEKSLSKKYLAQWHQKMAVYRLTLPPGLTLSQFKAYPQIQRKLRAAVGSDGSNPVNISWNKKAFYKQVYQPAANKASKALLNRMNADVADYRDGGKYAEDGKNALRVLVIPPIALILSLFLVLVTALNMTQITLRLADIELPVLGSIAIKIATITLLVATPPLLTSNKYTAPSSEFNLLLGNIESQLVTAAMKWEMHAQPWSYPFASRWTQSLTGTIIEISNQTLDQLSSLSPLILTKER